VSGPRSAPNNIFPTDIPISPSASPVLYTDTGGGTGNMTRHRCPIGLSYRSSAHGSSTDTVEAGQQSSFESTVSGLQRITEARPTLSLTINVNSVVVYLRGVSESSSSAQLISQTSGEVSIETWIRRLANGHKDMLGALISSIRIFSGKGFRALLDRMWQLSKRSSTSPHDVFPDTQMLQSALQTNLRFCMDDLKNELSRTSQGVCLAVESLSYYDKEFRVVHGSRISHDWKWRSNVLGVFKVHENQTLAEVVNTVINNYDLDKNLLRITCAGGGEEFSPAKSFPDIKEKLREVLHAVLSSCSVPLLPSIALVEQIVKTFLESDVRLPFPSQCSGDDIFTFYPLLRDFNFHFHDIKDIIQSKFQGVAGVKASELLIREQTSTITVEHRIAAILNPRHNRKLNLICTDHE
ncbi:hypothetical protein OSTOST_14861, partial [Ostertagia ostertagi]